MVNPGPGGPPATLAVDSSDTPPLPYFEEGFHTARLGLRKMIWSPLSQFACEVGEPK